ncbi:hypothetical protein DENSPDRAFT_797206 [Dentipellis sp. KUC8613]|nr:hypothetical protein DENSPDRAFT_797206 [Dentipellis sp. KUC8613]
MTSLHAYFALRNQHAFQRLLEGISSRGQSNAQAGTSSSGGKSWNRPSAMTTAAASHEVNARDWLGRTVLHLACSATDPAALEYVRLLLAHPGINVNLSDTENHWTPLHRALYNGNLAAAMLLLQRSDIDTTLTDLEGYRAFDLYNTTVEDTKPPRDAHAQMELFTWGTNRNATLGVSDGDDRSYPEQIPLKRIAKLASDSATAQSAAFRLQTASVRDVQMSRLHTVVVTDEPRSNVRACGFASTGRLGPVSGQHTQIALSPVQGLDQKIISVALGQDHTLALTATGSVFSWGLNRFSQLGYAVEAPPGMHFDEPIQSVPRIITGPLRKEIVQGVAACKTASACWTETEVYTWGKNNGQLGYDKAAQPVQPIPRVVSRVNKPVIMISMTDTAMACLTNTKDVILLYNDGHAKINIPAQGFPSEILAYRPPQAINNSSIAKVVSCDSMFAAISSNGEIFTFSPPTDGASSGKDRGMIKPQRVWALRKQWSAVRDAALGSDGSIVICTESGHVFVRSRNLKSGQTVSAKSFKFQRVPYIQRAVGVRANDTGAFAALRVEYRPDPIPIVGNSLAQDLASVRPWVRYDTVAPSDAEDVRVEPTLPSTHEDAAMPIPVPFTEEDDESSDDMAVEADVQELLALQKLIQQDALSRKRFGGRGLFEGKRLAHGADLLIRVPPGIEFPVHRAVLAARSKPLAALLSGGKGKSFSDTDGGSGLSFKLSGAQRLAVSGAHVLSVLVLMHYLYSDQLLAIWDPRVSRCLAPALGTLQPAQVTRELQALARVLGLEEAGEALRAATKRTPEPTLARDVGALFHDPAPLRAVKPDVVLKLRDSDVHTHSVVLRARTVFFAAFFDDEDWTRERWTAEGTVEVDLRHLEWRAMEYVLRFMCCGEEGEMFETLSSIDSVDALLDFMFAIMCAANELLLDRLLLICSSVILRYINLNNACSVLADAEHLLCLPLMERLHRYLAVNMETLLESRMLDDLTPRLIKQLSQLVRAEQTAKAPVSRSNRLVEEAMRKNIAWLELQDIPGPTIRTAPSKGSPKLTPKKGRRTSIAGSPAASPLVQPRLSTRTSQLTLGGGSGDDVFIMDDVDAVPALNLDVGEGARAPETPTKAGPWKSRSTMAKVDMKSILAEAEESRQAMSRPVPPPLSKAPSKDRILATESPSRSPGTPGISRVGSSSTPWRTTAAPLPPAPLVAVGPATPRTDAPVPRASPAPEAAALPRIPSAPATPLRHTQSPATKAPQHPGLGPVISPARQVPSSSKQPSINRRVSSFGNAWQPPPVQPVVQSSGPGGGPALSFAAIQQAQREQEAASGKDMRSLKEIQEEERALQVEADFLKWWTAEEERLRQEEAAVQEAVHRASLGGKPKKPRGEGKKKPKGDKGKGVPQASVGVKGKGAEQAGSSSERERPQGGAKEQVAGLGSRHGEDRKKQERQRTKQHRKGPINAQGNANL